jgi:hypothetical protein
MTCVKDLFTTCITTTTDVPVLASILLVFHLSREGIRGSGGQYGREIRNREVLTLAVKVSM